MDLKKIIDTGLEKTKPVVEAAKDAASVTTDLAKTAFNRATMQKDPKLLDRTKKIVEKKVEK